MIKRVIMSKTVKITASILVILILLIACTKQTQSPTITVEKPAKAGACDVETEECAQVERGSVKALVSNNVEIITLKESLDLLDDTAVLFFSFDDCPWCYDAWPIIEKVWREYKIPLYYVSIERTERDSTNPDYQTLYEKVKSEVEDKVYMPFALFLYNGEIIGSNTGTVEGHEITNDGLPLMTNEQKKELENIYKKLFEEIRIREIK